MSILSKRITTTASLRKAAAPQCSICKERKNQVMWLDDNHNLVCEDCTPERFKGVSGKRVD